MSGGAPGSTEQGRKTRVSRLSVAVNLRPPLQFVSKYNVCIAPPPPSSNQVEVPSENTSTVSLNYAEVAGVSRVKGHSLSSSHTASFFTLNIFPICIPTSVPVALRPCACPPPLFFFFFHAHFQSPELRDLSDYRCGECFCSPVLMH